MTPVQNIILAGLILSAIGFGLSRLISVERDPDDKTRKLFRMVGVIGVIVALIAANVYVMTHLFHNI